MRYGIPMTVKQVYEMSWAEKQKAQAEEKAQVYKPSFDDFGKLRGREVIYIWELTPKAWELIRAEHKETEAV